MSNPILTMQNYGKVGEYQQEFLILHPLINIFQEMKKKRIIISAFLTTFLSVSAEITDPATPIMDETNPEECPTSATDFRTIEPGWASVSLPKKMPHTTSPAPADAPLGTKLKNAFDPSIKFGGYIVGKYSINDNDKRDSEGKRVSNSTFDLRFVRLYANGYCFNDFYYRLQLEINDAPGNDKGPRIVDAFVEWQKWDFLRVKLGQFKRSFGFENPYSPLVVGMGSYSQATMKLASINDRIGEHKSSGRDLGAQLQGDLFPAADGHYWLHYQVGLFNGQGINHVDKDNFKDLIGGAWISPIKDLSIGSFGWNGRYTNEKYTPESTNQLREARRVRWGVGMKYESDWTIRGEYMASKGGIVTNAAAPHKSDAWYATVGAPVCKNVKMYARWDCYRDAKTWNSLQTNYGLSANWSLGKNLILQANYTFTDKRGTPAAGNHYNTFDIQVYARF